MPSTLIIRGSFGMISVIGKPSLFTTSRRKVVERSIWVAVALESANDPPFAVRFFEISSRYWLDSCFVRFAFEDLLLMWNSSFFHKK